MAIAYLTHVVAVLAGIDQGVPGVPCRREPRRLTGSASTVAVTFHDRHNQESTRHRRTTSRSPVSLEPDEYPLERARYRRDPNRRLMHCSTTDDRVVPDGPD